MSETLLKYLAVLLFGCMYLGMVFMPRLKMPIAAGTALSFVLLGILPFNEVAAAINWNALLMIGGTMVLVHYFIESGMPSRLADIIVSRVPSLKWAAIAIALFAGIISAFIDNVATVLIMVPVGLALCRSQGISPVGMVIAIAVSSNLQGAATLVGDTTSIVLATHASMDFMDFFWLEGRPGIFFAVELGALATVPVMLFLFRRNRKKPEPGPITQVSDYFPSFAIVLMVGALILASFFPDKPALTGGLICVSAAGLLLLRDVLFFRNKKSAVSAVKSIDYETLAFLASLFCVIAGISRVGIIAAGAHWVTGAAKDNLLVLYSLVLWGSVVISAFVDNIPYVAAMLPLLKIVTETMGTEPYLLYFALLSGATLGGNLTPIGASANITAIGMLRREGYQVSFRDFALIGVPFTLAAVTAAYIFLWLVWNPA